MITLRSQCKDTLLVRMLDLIGDRVLHLENLFGERKKIICGWHLCRVEFNSNFEVWQKLRRSFTEAVETRRQGKDGTGSSVAFLTCFINSIDYGNVRTVIPQSILPPKCD